MEVDFSANVKSLVMAITRYQSSKSENNLSQILRHIEVLLGGLKLADIQKLFNSRNVLGTECITCITRTLPDPGTDSHLVGKLVELLILLSKVSEIREHLQDSFGISSILCSYIVKHCAQEQYGHLIPQMLTLLDKVTYGRVISSGIANIDQLLPFIFAELEKDESDTVLPSLRVLNNLVVNNISLQVQVKSMMDKKRTKSFMRFLKQGATKYSILCLSILTCVFWGDDIVKNLYKSQNWFTAMKLIFSTLADSNSAATQDVAGDLCIELLRHEEIARQIAMYEEDNSCTIRLIDSLSDAPIETASKIMEVVLAFCRVSYVRSGICQRILDGGLKRWNELLRIASTGRHDLALPLEKSPSLLALDLVKEICEDVVESAKEPNPGWLDCLFPVIDGHLSHPFHADLSQLKLSLSKISKSLQVYLCLCSEDDDLLAKVASNMTYKLLGTVVEEQMTHNLTGIVSSQPDWSELGVDVVFLALELMLKVKQSVHGLEKTLYDALQDNRMVPFFVSAFSSAKSHRVQCALRLHHEASSLPDFPVILLGEKMAEHNGHTESKPHATRHHDYIRTRHASEDNGPYSNLERPNTVWNDMRQGSPLDNISVASVSSGSSSDDKENVDILVDRMQGKLGLGKMNSKTLQVMEVYEQKISSMQTKETHLQDLLDAKALALAQADRVIAQNRCQRAQSEEECRRLAQLLQESEVKCERLLHEMNEIENSRQEVEKELETTVEENKGLQKIADQYDGLQSAFNDKIHRIEVQERNYAALAQEYETLKELHDMMQKHSEKLKVQHSEAVNRLEELEEERLKLLKDSGDKQMQIHELESVILEHEKVARQLLEEKSELEATLKNAKSTVQNLEEEVKGLKIKVTSQERTKQQLEHQIKERGVEIKRLHQRNEAQEKKTAALYNEKETLTREVAEKNNEVRRLNDKLTEQKQTFLKITELSAALQNSQS